MKKTLFVALCVCIVCSVLVSTAAVSLQGIQEENRKLDRIRNIFIAGDIPVESENIKLMYEKKVRPIIVDVQSGKPVPDSGMNDRLDPDHFDIQTMAADREYGMEIPSGKDRARIKRMPKYMVIYSIMDNQGKRTIVLPVFGKGLWSTMYGFIALDDDLQTVKGFTVYQHAETPGLGGEVDNVLWKKSWKGKQALDEEGKVKIEVLKGKVDMSRQEAGHQIDGLSGATLTSRGVDSLVRFWLGESGYGLFLKRLKEGADG